MERINSPYPPGMVGLISADDHVRYQQVFDSIETLLVPQRSQYKHVGSCNVARNLNLLVDKFLEQLTLQWLWVLCDDACFDRGVLLRLLKHDVDAVVPLTLRRGFPWTPVIYKTVGTGPVGVPGDTREFYTWEEISGFPSLFPIPGCGGAGLLIKRRVFETMEKPWFRVGTLDPVHLEEDMGFTNELRQLGFGLYCDPYTVMGHIGSVMMTPQRDANGQLGVETDVNGYKTTFMPSKHPDKRKHDLVEVA